MKKIVPLLLVVFCLFSPLVLTACHGEGFDDVGNLTCTIGMTEDNPFVYQQVWKFDYADREQYLNVLTNMFTCTFTCPSRPDKTFTFMEIMEAGAIITGWDPTKATDTPQMMQMTFEGYTCKLYYVVNATPKPVEPET